MATYLLTVSSVERANLGIRLLPGIRMSEAKERPGISKMIQGCRLELRLPDNTKRSARLVTYGVPVERQDDGTIIYRGDITKAEIRLTISLETKDGEISAGTEVWLLDEDNAGGDRK